LAARQQRGRSLRARSNRQSRRGSAISRQLPSDEPSSAHTVRTSFVRNRPYAPRSPGAPISLRSMRFFTSILCLSVWGATLVAWQRYINHGNAFP
jgi:hypothetical protein